MRRHQLIAVLVLLGVGGLLWLMIPSTPAESAKDEAAKKPLAKKSAADFDDDESTLGLEGASPKLAKRDKVEAAPVEKLDPNSPEFFNHVDNVLPDHLYDIAAQKCYRPKLDRNELISFNYRMRAKDGVITVEDVKVTEQRMKDPTLAECFIEAVKSASWRDEKMPDWDDEDDLYVAVRGLKKHMGDDFPDDPDDRIAQTSDQPVIEDDGEGPVNTNPSPTAN